MYLRYTIFAYYHVGALVLVGFGYIYTSIHTYLCIWYDGKNSHDSVLCDLACRLELEHIRAVQTSEQVK